MSAHAVATGAGQRVSTRLIDWLTARHGAVVDVQFHVRNAEEMAARTVVRSIDGLCRRWVEQAAHEALNQQRLGREHLARDSARHAKAYVEALRIAALHQLGPRTLADALERLERNGYPRLRAVIDELRRLGDFWPVT